MKRSTLSALFCALTALVTNVAASAAPCAGFTDVDTEDPAKAPFCTSVEWMKNRAITLGCTSTLYCPDDYVTRLQMAAFMYRLGFQNAFLNGGNAFGATAVLGTTDDQALDVRVNGARVMRYEPNSISPNVIGGSPANSVTAGVRGATIAGGGVPTGDTEPSFMEEAPNRVTDVYGTVGGGYANRAGNNAGTVVDAPFATVGGGFANTASGDFSTVGGGTGNTASGYASTTVGGGTGNTAEGYGSTVAGGDRNLAYGYNSFAGGGLRNLALGNWSTVGGGEDNDARGNSSAVGGGAGNIADGFASTVPGGYINLAQGDHSFAAGTRAKALHNNTFVWGGSTTIDTNSLADGDFVVYAPTIRMLAGAPGSGGCTLSSGTSGWACVSDRMLKSEVELVDGVAVLEQLAALPIARWSFMSVPGTAHMGPMAQDFHATFKLGDDATRLAPMDVQGVALAAIQGLNAKLEAALASKDAETAALKRELADLRAAHQKELAELRLAVEVLMARTSPEERVAQGR